MGTRQAFAEFSGLARFDSQADLPTSAASNTAALHHPACCAFGVFFFHFFVTLGSGSTASSRFTTTVGYPFSLVYGQRSR
jgi:hypothetical protein